MSTHGADQQGDVRALELALAAYAVVFAAKLAAYFASGVMALFAEALHTLSDIFISGFLLVALLYSRRRPDERHMFGYGRAQNVASVVAATLFISFTSFELYREAIPRLLAPQPAAYENLPLALGGIAWGFPLADPIAAVVVATLIAANAVGMFLENARLLLGLSPGPAFLSELRRTALAVPGVVAVNDVRAEFVGPQTVHAGIRIAVRAELSVAEAAGIAAEIERRVHSGTQFAHCFVQAEPAAS